MSISSYEKDGKKLWKVYVNVRSPDDPSIREQKLVNALESEKAAIAEEKRILRELTGKMNALASQGLTWGAVIDRWQETMRSERAYYAYEPTTIIDHGSTLRRWTAEWLNRPAGSLTRADGREIMVRMEEEGKARNFRKNVKHTINVVFKWGIEERLIKGVHSSPVEGLKLMGDKAEAVPDIFTIEEIRKLLLEAKQLEHPWYPVWATGLLTGMRSGELHSLLWSDVDLENRRITVSKSYNTRTRTVKCTKAGYWRTVPISDELYALLSELKTKTGDQPHVLPRFWEWDKGEQARVLRKFCEGIGIRSICFHALRACFATQLLAHDIASARIMKVCGWRDLKTMQRYIRLAGVEEKGATQVLRILPSDTALMGEVVNIFKFKAENQ